MEMSEVLPWSNETSFKNETLEILKKIDDRLHHQDCSRNIKSWCCIYRVAQSLKKVHEESSTFHPKIVSIGPFHHNQSEHLKLMDEHKSRFFRDFLKSLKLITSSTHAGATTYDDTTIIMTRKKQYLVAEMKKLEADARACYSETFDDLGSNEFVIMMLFDGCFIIQLLHLFRNSGNGCKDTEDSVCTWRSTLSHLRHDLLLLENQLPFFILDKLFEMSGIDKEVYTDLILDFFNPVLYREKKVLDDCKKPLVSSNNKAHLLELFMSSFQTTKTGHQVALQVQEDDDQHIVEDSTVGRFSLFIKKISYNISKKEIVGPFRRLAAYIPKDIPNDHDQTKCIHCVTELREAGIVFKKRDDYDLLKIEFSGGKLQIPTLFMDHITVPVLLNFIAYEQRHHSIKPYFTSYLMFLDRLVNSSKDVEYLHYKGIIHHGLGSDEEVAALFNKLCKEVVQDLGVDNYLSEVFTGVNEYFGKKRNRWWAAWKHEYFRNPWAFSSFLAAVVLLILTFLQTFFSMYAYFNPAS